MAKVAIIMQAGPGTHEGLARVFNGLVFAKELSEKGNEVRLIFDGASTEWLHHWANPKDDIDRQVGAFFGSLKQAGLTYAVCHY